MRPQAIAPLLVILRVAQRRAWTMDTAANLTATANRVTDLEFHRPDHEDTFQARSPQELTSDTESTLTSNQAMKRAQAGLTTT